jgi:methyl-accepting chemotaxis protein
MASLDELIREIQGLVERIDQTINSVGGVADGAEELQDQFSALGVEDKARHMSQVKDGADQVRNHLQAAADSAKELISQVEAAKG